ncbi:PAS domain-containing sensor histidine kinase [Bacteroidota bacterium]
MHIKLGLAVLIIFQTTEIIIFLNRIRLKLIHFFDTIRTGDFSSVFSGKDKVEEFSNLNDQLKELSDFMLKAKIENEKQNQYYKAVIDHVATAIIVYTTDGCIKFANSAAFDLLGCSRLKSLVDLDRIKPGFSEFLKQLQPGQQQLSEIVINNEQLQIVAKSSVYIISEEKLILISLQNILPELERRETQTWQDMMRILTHEIMNSVSPITSLAGSLSKLIYGNQNSMKEILLEKDRNKIDKGLQTIQKRGEGLMDFVQKYRKINLIPEPDISTCQIGDIFNEVIMLFEEQFRVEKIKLRMEIKPSDLKIRADREQIEQVLINLMKNAFQSFKNADIKEISLNAFVNEGNKIIINVTDSGIGIKKELLGKIFMPFYSTKDEGDGIGLSLSRQIMLLHGGSISVQSQPDKGSCFTLCFNTNM